MILHIARESDWLSAVPLGAYRADSLQTEGFIHCSTLEQVLGPANAMFHGQDGLVLLCIDPEQVAAPIVYEDCYESGQAFPHIYGPLEVEAVTAVIPFPPQEDGSFILPEVFELQARNLELKKREIPLLEYDGTVPAVLEPSQLLDPIDVPEHCVLSFFQDVISDYKEAGRLKELFRTGSEIGPNPLYVMNHNGKRLAVLHAGVGAPLSAAFMEELIALGCRKFIACGGCGVLDGRVGLGHVIVPTAAVRDEGTSYHYLPPAREIELSSDAVKAIMATLDSHKLAYALGKTWTTDGVYRETTAKVALRREEGCLCVEMETAALAAVAQFRGVTFGQLLYGGDDLSGDAWDHRDWQNQTSTREKLFLLAAEACLSL